MLSIFCSLKKQLATEITEERREKNDAQINKKQRTLFLLNIFSLISVPSVAEIKSFNIFSGISVSSYPLILNLPPTKKKNDQKTNKCQSSI